jgi:broad specificity phosphatase PhoE
MNHSRTLIYLVRHAATAANLAEPPVLQGRGMDIPLAPIGIDQAEATRDFLAQTKVHHCYCSPLQRAMQTATILSAPHGVTPRVHHELTECDVGRWEGLDWDTIRSRDPDAHRKFMERPGKHGYPDGESFADVERRAAMAMEQIFSRHPGQSILVVSHRVVNRVYLASLLGMTPNEARRVNVDNCSVSVIEHQGSRTRLVTLNAVFHLKKVS